MNKFFIKKTIFILSVLLLTILFVKMSTCFNHSLQYRIDPKTLIFELSIKISFFCGELNFSLNSNSRRSVNIKYSYDFKYFSKSIFFLILSSVLCISFYLHLSQGHGGMKILFLNLLIDPVYILKLDPTFDQK